MDVTRRAVWGPLFASMALSACAPLLPSVESALGPKGWREASAHYGADPRQSLSIYRPQKGATCVVMILSDPQLSLADTALARLISAQGMTAIVVGRRSSSVEGFPAYSSDAARALAWIVTRAEAIGISPDRVGILGVNQGGHTALMLAQDGRYLASVGMTGRLAYVAVASLDPPLDATLTHPSAYPQTKGGPGLWKGEEYEIEQAIHLLKQHLILP